MAATWREGRSEENGGRGGAVTENGCIFTDSTAPLKVRGVMTSSYDPYLANCTPSSEHDLNSSNH